MKKELEKIYNPQKTETKIYKIWEDSGYFNPDNLVLKEDAPCYTIVLPPPNITAILHVGHSVTIAIEDLLIRYHRLRGFRALWIPGTDHAAIATQSVVEKKLFKEKGLTRHDLGKEKFLETVWLFVNETQKNILQQIKKMGASLDWSRLAFTLDEPRRQAVSQMFIEMYRAGAIYRGERIVNWCPRCQSTLADDEVDHQEHGTKLYTFKYDDYFPISISTTRPETKLGDTAVAVNPKDERYKKFIGQKYQVNFCGQQLDITIIGDYEVDPSFGTGALGVTPAHSMVDWQMAEKNQLNIIKVINEQGLIKNGFGEYSGLSVAVARHKIIEKLYQLNLLEKEEEIVNSLSLCYRCDTAIEPLPSKQWFVGVNNQLACLKQKSLKEMALAVVTNNEIEFIPERFTKRYRDWMDNLHDWCISRQIWFGHPIPAWHRGEEIVVSLEKPVGDGWQPDPDTLDTWFSSGMWTFSTLGWPNNLNNEQKKGDLAKFHPTQILETGYEILTLWVSRMIMMSLFALKERPFNKVYLHGMILDAHGKKMSKSKGNGVDPVVEIEKYGADALRLALLMGATPGNDSRYSTEKVEAKRNFINKLWNISRFILSSKDDEENNQLNNNSLADDWIHQQLIITSEIVSKHLDQHCFSLAAEELLDFTWNRLADWYLEIAKVEKNKKVFLVALLKKLLILWHPFIPFVTEEIWLSFNDGLLMVERWPLDSDRPIMKKETQEITYIAEEIKRLQEIIVAIRNARSINKIDVTTKLRAIIYAGKHAAKLLKQRDLILNLKTGLSSLEILTEGPEVKEAISLVVGEITIYLIGDETKKIDNEKLKKELNVQEKLVAQQKQKLSNQDFLERAPAKIVLLEKSKLVDYEIELNKLKNLLKEL